MPTMKPVSSRKYPSDIAFTTAVKSIQTQKGSRQGYAGMESGDGWETTVTPELVRFLADLDMFYLGTSNAENQPYIQYRGGSPGFLRVLDEKTLGFAEFGGNRQYVTLGNLSENPKAAREGLGHRARGRRGQGPRGSPRRSGLPGKG